MADPLTPAQLERRAAILSLIVGIALMAIKFIAYLMTDSAAVLSDALESIVNVVAGGFALYAIILAHLPADQEHPYGHGKIEFLSAGFEGGMIVLAALVVAARAIDRLFHPQLLEQVDSGLILIALAMVINAAMGLYLIRYGKRGGSITLEADGKHLLSDAVTSLVVIVALLIVWLARVVWHAELPWVDSVAALSVAGYIAWMSIGLLRRSAAGLMDEQDLKDDARIRAILDSHLSSGGKQPIICSYHKLRHRHSGRYHWVDFHIVMPADWNIDRGHRIASAIEYEIELSLGEGNATAHVEPCYNSKCEHCPIAADEPLPPAPPGFDPPASSGATAPTG